MARDWQKEECDLESGAVGEEGSSFKSLNTPDKSTNNTRRKKQQEEEEKTTEERTDSRKLLIIFSEERDDKPSELLLRASEDLESQLTLVAGPQSMLGDDGETQKKEKKRNERDREEKLLFFFLSSTPTPTAGFLWPLWHGCCLSALSSSVSVLLLVSSFFRKNMERRLFKKPNISPVVLVLMERDRNKQRVRKIESSTIVEGGR